MKISYLGNNQNNTEYYFDKTFVKRINSTGIFNEEYVYHGTTLIGQINPNGVKEFNHPDHLGSTSLTTNSTGSLVEETTYYPYGEVFEGGSSRYDYTGKETDLTGLSYYGQRYYSADVLRRFTQADSLISDVYNPQALNRYAYVLNNPYKYVDPDGNVWQYFLLRAGQVALGAYSAIFTGQSETIKESINKAEKIAKDKPGTPVGDFNQIYSEQLKYQNTVSNRLLLKFTYGSKDVYSISEREYIKNVINPHLENFPNENIPSDDIFNILDEKFQNDKLYKSFKNKFYNFKNLNANSKDYINRNDDNDLTRDRSSMEEPKKSHTSVGVVNVGNKYYKVTVISGGKK